MAIEPKGIWVFRIKDYTKLYREEWNGEEIVVKSKGVVQLKDFGISKEMK